MAGLSPRLAALAQLVIRGEPMADIGTDHGLLPLHCLKAGLVPHAVLTDIGKGPLERAAKTMSALDPREYSYSLRLGAGLAPLEAGEVSTVVLAGMGGELMAEILGEYPEKTASAKLLVLQPRTKSGSLREWLWENGYAVGNEMLVRERGLLCQIFTASKGCQEPYEFPDIPKASGELMAEFLQAESERIRRAAEGLSLSSCAKSSALRTDMLKKLARLSQMREEIWKS